MRIKHYHPQSDRKRTSSARRETLRRKEVRAAKYARYEVKS